MLANMEEESLRRVFECEEFALSLLEQVRWPDDPACPYCGAAASDESDGDTDQTICRACDKTHTVVTGTMFEGSSVRVRHWFFLIHQMWLSEACPPIDDLMRELGYDSSAILDVFQRAAESFRHQGLPPGGDELKRAIATRNRELSNDEFARGIIEYAQLTAVRDRIVKAARTARP